MSRAGWAMAATVAVIVLGLGLAGWLARAPEDAPGPGWVAAPDRPAGANRPRASGWARSAAGEADPAADKKGWSAAHTSVAKALGYVPIACWVGPEWDSEDLVGAWHQKIRGGWYSNIETALTGSHGVERRYVDPDAPQDRSPLEGIDFETLFVVAWEATEPGVLVPCSVRFPVYGEFRVQVVDRDDGVALDGVEVYGCGAGATSEDGVAVLGPVFAGEECELAVLCRGDDRLCVGSRVEPPLAEHEVRTTTIEVALHRTGDPPEHLLALLEEERLAEEAAAESLPAPPVPTAEHSYEEELAILRRLANERDLSARGVDLVDELIAHREWVLEEEARRESIMAEVEALEEELSKTTSRADGIELLEEIRALWDDILR